VNDAEESEVFGFNTEISVEGMIFHVQTESSDDVKSPTINTLIYHKGFLMKKISTSYSDLFAAGDMTDQLKERVKRQHFAAVDRVKNGEFLARPG
jgi:thioredoxin reductase